MTTRRDAPRTKVETASRSESAPTVFPPDAKRRTASTPRRAAPTNEASRSSSRTGSPSSGSATDPRVEISREGRYRMIAEAAYLRAERRGFEPGREVEDWLAAEQEVERLLAAEHVSSPQ